MPPKQSKSRILQPNRLLQKQSSLLRRRKTFQFLEGVVDVKCSAYRVDQDAEKPPLEKRILKLAILKRIKCTKPCIKFKLNRNRIANFVSLKDLHLHIYSKPALRRAFLLVSKRFHTFPTIFYTLYLHLTYSLPKKQISFKKM